MSDQVESVRLTDELGGETKCSVRNGNEVLPCLWLDKASEYGNPGGKKKGIFAWRLVNMKSGELSRLFFGVKSGEHVEKGMALTFCPFCGERIDAPFAT